MLYWSFLSLLSAEPVNTLVLSLDREIEDQILFQLQDLDDKQREKVLRSFEDTVFASARIRYELGLQYYQSGDVVAAEMQYQEALKVDPAYVPALYDLAEILLMRGDISTAKQHFMTLQQAGPHWVVSYRLAQIAARERDTKQMEVYLKRALREGMPSQILVDDKVQWRSYVQVPEIGRSIELLLSALGHDSIWNEIRSAKP